MLYKLGKTHNTFDHIEPLAFQGLPQEKELENLLANSLWEILYESNQYLPIFQERSWQPEADVYALDKAGDLVVFELKKETASGGAVHQILRYSEKASRIKYDALQNMLRTYKKDNKLDLREEHKDRFDLEHPLDKTSFNRKQHLIIVGCAMDIELIRNIDYWRSQGVLLDFIPYRVYNISSEYYFEFFSLPYDIHSNPAYGKGVIFDTNKTYDEEAVWYMCENNRVAAFGDIKGIVHSLSKGDIVFLYHKGMGIIAAGKVQSAVKEDEQADAFYCDLKWLTTKPTRASPTKPMPAWRIKEVMERNFWWAITLKVPYLTMQEAEHLLDALKKNTE